MNPSRVREWLRANRGRLVVGMLLAVATYYVVWGGEYSLFDLRQLRAERDREARVVDSLRSVADSLEAWADSLRSDPSVIERVARERYGFIRDGERLYRFVPPATGDSSGAGSRLDDTAGPD